MPKVVTAEEIRQGKRRSWRQRELEQDIDLAPDEKLLFFTDRHWLVLLRLLLVPLLIGGFTAGLAVYRALGGEFFLPEAGPEGRVDLYNIALLVAVLAVAFIAFRPRKKRLGLGNMLLTWASLALLGALFWFRYSGGRVFSVNRFAAAPVDAFNILLYLVVLACVGWCAYFFLDWLSDQLVLTNLRIIDDDEIPFVRHIQEQIMLADVQNVSAVTNTYPQEWLRYGTIRVQSATFGREILFDYANRPREFQDALNAQLKQLRNQLTEEQFRAMINKRIYAPPGGDKQANAPQAAKRLPPFVVRWILEENPQKKPDGTITWRPHWIFVLVSLLRPVGTLVLLLLLTLIGVRVGLLDGGLFAAAITVSVLIFLGWSAWEIEDHVNDLYILTPTTVTDIDKKPFGPEDRRTASLGSIQNVNFKTTFVSQMLGYGDVFLDTAGTGGRFTFHRVPRAPEVVSLVNEYMAAFRKGEKERNLNDTLTLIKHYHDGLKRHNEITEG